MTKKPKVAKAPKPKLTRDFWETVMARVKRDPRFLRAIVMETNADKIASGLHEALAYAKIDALWTKTEEEQRRKVAKGHHAYTQYDWGFRDGLHAARELFGSVAPSPEPERIAEIAKRFIPRAAGNTNVPTGQALGKLHAEWMKDPQYAKAYQTEAKTPFSPGEAEAAHARAKDRVEKALRSPPVQANLKKHRAKVLKKLKKKDPAK